MWHFWVTEVHLIKKTFYESFFQIGKCTFYINQLEIFRRPLAIHHQSTYLMEDIETKVI